MLLYRLEAIALKISKNVRTPSHQFDCPPGNISVYTCCTFCMHQHAFSLGTHRAELQQSACHTANTFPGNHIQCSMLTQKTWTPHCHLIRSSDSNPCTRKIQHTCLGLGLGLGAAAADETAFTTAVQSTGATWTGNQCEACEGWRQVLWARTSGFMLKTSGTRYLLGYFS